jgi:YteA family regulatory protein
MTDLAGFKERLQAEKARLEQEIEHLDHFDLDNSLQDSISELSSYDNHPADLASETFEREKDLGLLDSLRMRWRNISHALERIEDGTYGVCRQCQKAIDPQRLEAVPETSLCIDCQKELEGLTSERERPIEEESLGPPFGRTFLDGRSEDVAYDGEDAWQEVARYGTSETPQDIGADITHYDEMYIDDHERRGIVDELDGIISEEYPEGIPPEPAD